MDTSPTQHLAPAVSAKGPSTPEQVERNTAYAAGDVPEPHVLETPPRSPAVAAAPAPRAAQGPQVANVADLNSHFEPAARQVCFHCDLVLRPCYICLILPMPNLSCPVILACFATITELDKGYIWIWCVLLSNFCFLKGCGT